MIGLHSLKKMMATMNIRDISMYKTTVVAFSLGLAMYVPEITSLPLRLYSTLFGLFLVLVLMMLLQGKKHARSYVGRLMEGAHTMSLSGWAIFEIYLIIASLWIAKLFPVILTIPSIRYVSVFLFGLGYIIGMLRKQT